ESMQRLSKEQRIVTTHKQGTRGDKAFEETTTRELPANVQWVKVALRALEQLGKLETKPYLPPEEPDARARERIMHNELQRLRDEAERAGKVSSSRDPWGVLKRWKDALVGQGNDGKQPDPAMQELARAIVPACQRQTEE